MTDLLSPATRRSGAATPPPGRRPLSLTCVVAGAAASGGALLICMAVGLAGWFAADAGRYGDTRDAIRVGADAWLMAHGAQLRLDGVTVTAVPLGLTLLSAYLAYRLGTWAAASSAVDDLRAVLTGTTVLVGVYASVATLTAVLASTEAAESSPARAFLGGVLLASVAGGAGVLAGSGQGGSLRDRLPAPVRTVLRGGAAIAMAVVGACFLLVATALLVDFGAAATVLSRLHTDGPGGLMYTVVVVVFVPNAALLAGGYLVGPGFAVGTGTLVSPTAVVLGPVPAFPLLAALPADGTTPWWTAWLIGVPVLISAAAAYLVVRRGGLDRYEVAAGCGLAAGLLSALALTVAAVAAGGSVGPGRMADVGVTAWPMLLAAGTALGGGGLLGGVVAAWRTRRTSTAEVAAG